MFIRDRQILSGAARDGVYVVNLKLIALILFLLFFKSHKYMLLSNIAVKALLNIRYL